MLDTERIKQQFNTDASEYDKKRKIFIPCFDEYYIETTARISKMINAPKCVLDLGAGTGLLTTFWCQAFPDSKYVLDDISVNMLDKAKERFDIKSNFEYVTTNYNQELPECDFDTVISALSIHHLNQKEKQSLFNRIADRLEKGNVFVNYDMFISDTEEETGMMNDEWETMVLNSALSNADKEHWLKGRSIDKECSVNEEINMLLKSGFSKVVCLFQDKKFAVIMARK